MIRYKSANQLSITEFRTPFELELDPNNRWVKLAKELPWDRMASTYYRKFSQKKGAPAIDARVVIGAVIVKHKMRLSDAETIDYIRENVYVQYFLGKCAYSYESVFTSSLFVYIRNRLALKEFEQMNSFLIELDEKQNEQDNDKFVKRDEKGNITHKGTAIVDATVTDAEIKYPTDLDLLNSARVKSEQLLSKISRLLNLPIPRNYREKAQTDYLSLIKKKVKSKKQLRKAIRKQLGYLRRNIHNIDRLLEQYPDIMKKLSKAEIKYFWVIQVLYDQQKEMYDKDIRQCSDRIVSIHQPHVRPIVRGKSKDKVEFGAKIGVCIHNGYVRIDHFSWDAYNESIDLALHVENYKKQYGYYPYRVLGDKIYLNRDNRALMKKLGIEVVGTPLGRPSNESKTPEYKAAARKASGERNVVEGCFGLAKRRYDMNDIRARLSPTSESWIAAGFFVLNIERFLKRRSCSVKQN